MFVEFNEWILRFYIFLYVKWRSWVRLEVYKCLNVEELVFLVKNLREGLIYYGEKEESVLFEVRMGF